jgi:glyoxylase-like metal-dependent hydrolase (beta-lactamase superfamily II)
VIDQAGVDRIADLGGIDAIAVSHPHFYTSMVEWSEAFGGVPIYLHNGDASWVCRPDPKITFWAGDTFSLAEGVTLVRCGGHFEGSTLLHWATGADGRGVLLGSDTLKVGWDLGSVSVMRSYPNLIPVGPSALRRLEEAISPLAYDRIYGAWTGHVIREGARDVVGRSLARYRAAIAQ